MDREKKYTLSFIGASLMLPEMCELARKALEEGIENVSQESIIRSSVARTANREFWELKARIVTLTARQLEILATGDFVSQKQIGLLSVCKAYAFIRDFVVEVVREKVLVFDYQITEGEYTTFYRRKSEAHPELEELADSTVAKVRQVTFKILEQAGLIDKVRSKKINLQLVDEKVIRAVVEDDPEWLKIYLMPDMEVANRAS